jgi:hypothetical protein
VPAEELPIGTHVSVYLDTDRIRTVPALTHWKSNITGYLRALAGFVEFPIVVHERSRRSVILSPRRNRQRAIERIGSGFEIISADVTFPWNDAIVAQDIPAARAALREIRLRLREDLKLDGYDGVLSYLVPAATVRDIERDRRFGVMSDGVVLRTKDERYSVRANPSWTSYDRDAVGMTPSAVPRVAAIAVYRDGILLPDASVPLEYRGVFGGRNALPHPRILVNLDKHIVPEVDISRTRMSGTEAPCYEPIQRAHERWVSTNSLERFARLAPKQRFWTLGRIMVWHRISATRMAQVIPPDMWCVPIITEHGRVRFREWSELKQSVIPMLPALYRDNISNILMQGPGPRDEIARWRGAPALVCDVQALDSFYCQAACDAVKQLLEDTSFVAELRLLCSNEPGRVLEQLIWNPRPARLPEVDVQSALWKLDMASAPLTSFELDWLQQGLGAPHLAPRVVPFAPSSTGVLATFGPYINWHHPVGRVVLRLSVRAPSYLPAAAIPGSRLLEEPLRGAASDALQIFARASRYVPATERRANLDRILRIAVDAGVIQERELATVRPESNTILSGSGSVDSLGQFGEEVNTAEFFPTKGRRTRRRS